MILILVLLSVILSNRVNGAQANDLTEEVAKAYFGMSINLLQEGKVDEYWAEIQRSIDTRSDIVKFEKAIQVLEELFVFNWNDSYCRMQWVTDPQKQIVDPVKNLCKSDRPFTLLPCFGKPVRAEDGVFLLKTFQCFRTYYILSEVAYYLYSKQAKNNQYKLRMHSEDAFRDLYQSYAVSALCEQKPLLRGRRIPSENIGQNKLIALTYTWYTHFLQNKDLQVFGLLSYDGVFPEYDWLAALAQGKLLIQMPYMVTGVIDAYRVHDPLLLDNLFFSVFERSVFAGATVIQGVSLYPNIFQQGLSLGDIINAMKEQMKGVSGNLREMLKIMCVFRYSMKSMFYVGNLLQESVDELIKCCAQRPSIGKSLRHIMLIEACQENEDTNIDDLYTQWHKRYFITGLKNIFEKKVIKPLRENRLLFAQEFLLEEKDISAFEILRILERIHAVGRYSQASLLQESVSNQLQQRHWRIKGRERLEREQLLIDMDCVDTDEPRVNNEQLLAQKWHAQLPLIKNIRCALWNIKRPFIGWNDMANVIIVCLPKQENMAPFIQEMHGLHCPLMPLREWLNIVMALCEKKSLYYFR